MAPTVLTTDDTAVRRATGRRMAVLSFVLISTATASLLLADLLWGMPLRGWNGVAIALFALLFALISFGGAQAFFGFIVRRGGGDPMQIGRSLKSDEEEAVALAPTAVVIPVFNEDVQRVMAGVRAAYRSLERTGRLDSFDIFILSDSNRPDQWVAEEIAWIELCRELNAQGRIFYRKRRVNSNKKAGNIADFCRRWGRRYRYMIVFDADSIMAGSTMVRMVRLMETNPGAGLIQTAPALARAETLFARILQFATRLYGPLFLSGLNYWQQGEGNYWGHNAIIRLAPFMEHCALPDLPGKEPFGGKILSHDFVEAALLRRAGWAVWMLTDAGGTYEEGPPTLIDAAKRDRRWSQGNLQHTWLLFARGLRTMSRVHLSLGIFSYAASLVWLISLLLGSLLVIGFNRTGLTWVPTPGYAGAIGIDPALQSGVLLGWTAILIFGPKLLALIDLFLQPGGARSFGGRAALFFSVLLENVFSVFLAPVLMIFHSSFVLLTVLGRGVRWVTQRRGGGDGTSWSEAIRTHGVQALLGIGWAVGLALYAPRLLPWMSPVLAGLLLAIPFSRLTSKESTGQFARRRGLFRTPEEIDPPPELRDVATWLESRPVDNTELPELAAERNLLRVVLDPYINAAHLCLLRVRERQPEPTRQHFAELRDRLLREGPGAISSQEKLSLLADRDSMEWLHDELWLRHESDLAPWWRLALRHYNADASGSAA